MQYTSTKLERKAELVHLVIKSAQSDEVLLKSHHVCLHLLTGTLGTVECAERADQAEAADPALSASSSCGTPHTGGSTDVHHYVVYCEDAEVLHVSQQVNMQSDLFTVIYLLRLVIVQIHSSGQQWMASSGLWTTQFAV